MTVLPVPLLANVDAVGLVCTKKILSALQKVFHCEFPEALIIGHGLHGGAYNLVLDARNLPVRSFNAILPGRYAMSGWKNFVYGGGAHLHLPSGGEKLPCCPPVPFLKENIGGQTRVRFTAHLDHGYPYHPFGLVYHLIQDKALSASREPCPGG